MLVFAIFFSEVRLVGHSARLQSIYCDIYSGPANAPLYIIGVSADIENELSGRDVAALSLAFLLRL